MHFIGITGGVGAGKSEILSYLEQMPDVIVVRADELARELMQPGEICYTKLAEAFSTEGVFDESGFLIPERMSRQIFSDENKRRIANGIVHPAVKDRILQMVQSARKQGRVRLFFLEAALLLEEGYDRLCDELWYIYAGEATRRKRLVQSRGYSDARITGILNSQMKEEVFRKRCQRIIDNDGELWIAKEQVQGFVRELLESEGGSGKNHQQKPQERQIKEKKR